MADFTDGAWGIFIMVVTVVSLIALGLAAFWGTRGRDGAGPETTVWDGDLREQNKPLPRWWLHLFYLTLFFGAGYLALYPGLGAYPGLLGWTETGQYREEMAAADRAYGPVLQKYLAEDLRSLAADPEALRIGRRLYANHCSACHGADARGAPGFPDLTDGDWLYGGDPGLIEISILEGRAGVMPPWEGVLSPEEIARVTAYVRGLSGQAAGDDAEGRGKAVFAERCTACHGPEARGNPAFGAPDLTDAVWLYGGSEGAVIDSIAKGRAGQMPGQEAVLGEAKAHLLAAYVWGLSAPKSP
jgi:cytochrome c oxidase cbb3-type subunit 3